MNLKFIERVTPGEEKRVDDRPGRAGVRCVHHVDAEKIVGLLIEDENLLPLVREFFVYLLYIIEKHALYLLETLLGTPDEPLGLKRECAPVESDKILVVAQAGYQGISPVVLFFYIFRG